MKELIFQLGTARELCLAELQALFPEVKLLGRQVALIKVSDQTDEQQLQARLGGTVKIAKVMAHLPKDTDENGLAKFVANYLLSLGSEKVYFAVGELERDHLPAVDIIAIKKMLEERKLKVRFSAGSRHGAGAALLLHRQKLTEVLIVNSEEEIVVARTMVVQDIDEWTRRDRGKPYADHKKGMLPPKLARIMINLAGVSSKNDIIEHNLSIYDPFCGTGTILLEAALDGYRLFGSDLDVKAVIGAKENLEWLAKEYQLKLESKILVKDVTQVHQQDLGQKIDLLVTEPFLGKQTPQASQLQGIFRGLGKMYWGAFRNWSKILNDGAKVVIVFPVVQADNGREFNLDSLLDKLKTLRYNKQSQKLIYARPQAIVKREICVFEWKKVDRQD